MEICPKCNKRKVYFRVAFGSYKCYSCGYEKNLDTPIHNPEVQVAISWWNSLPNDLKLKIHKEKEKWKLTTL
jgi:ribosomal protein L37AE/L43A